MKKFVSRSALAAAALAFGMSGADAFNTQTSNLSVSFTATATCATGGGSLNFGAATPGTLAAVIRATGSITVTCSDGTPYSVALDNGQHFAEPLRQMHANVSDLLGYKLSSSALGDNIINFGPRTGTGSSESLPVYGEIQSGQTVVAGSYSDTVSITVSY